MSRIQYFVRESFYRRPAQPTTPLRYCPDCGADLSLPESVAAYIGEYSDAETWPSQLLADGTLLANHSPEAWGGSCAKCRSVLANSADERISRR